MEKKKWVNGTFKRKYTPELMEECKSILDKRHIYYKIGKSPYQIMFPTSKHTYIFYITSDRWAVFNKEKTSSYYSKGLEDFLDRFLKPNEDKKDVDVKLPKKFTIKYCSN